MTNIKSKNRTSIDEYRFLIVTISVFTRIFNISTLPPIALRTHLLETYPKLIIRLPRLYECIKVGGDIAVTWKLQVKIKPWESEGKCMHMRLRTIQGLQWSIFVRSVTYCTFYTNPLTMQSISKYLFPKIRKYLQVNV